MGRGGKGEPGKGIRRVVGFKGEGGCGVVGVGGD